MTLDRKWPVKKEQRGMARMGRRGREEVHKMETCYRNCGFHSNNISLINNEYNKLGQD